MFSVIIVHAPYSQSNLYPFIYKALYWFQMYIVCLIDLILWPNVCLVILNKNMFIIAVILLFFIISYGNVGSPHYKFHSRKFQTILNGKNIFKLVLKLNNSRNETPLLTIQ